MRVALTIFVAELIFAIPAIALAAESVQLASGQAPQHPQQPQATVDATGAIHVAFGVGDVIHYCRSIDGGQTFSQPRPLPAVHAMSLGMRRGPRIAVAGDSICITAIGGKQGKGRDGDVLALRSTDGGQTWERPVVVNDVLDSAREGLHAMAAGSNGTMCSVWLDLRNQKSEVMASVSSDGGATWSTNTLVYHSPDGSVCQCCHPAVTFDSEGRIFVQWRNSLGGARDMYVASSSDRGQTFGQAVKLGTGTWPLDACPMDGGAIAATSPGKIASAWRRENDIFLSLDGQREERRLGTGEQPWITATSDGPLVVWLKKRGDAAYLFSPYSKEPQELARHAFDPVVAAGSDGKGPVVAVWETREGQNYTIQCRVVSNKK